MSGIYIGSKFEKLAVIAFPSIPPDEVVRLIRFYEVYRQEEDEPQEKEVSFDDLAQMYYVAPREPSQEDVVVECSELDTQPEQDEVVEEREVAQIPAPVELWTEAWALSKGIPVNPTLLVHLGKLRTEHGGNVVDWVEKASTRGVGVVRSGYVLSWASQGLLEGIVSADDVARVCDVRKEITTEQRLGGKRLGGKSHEDYNDKLFPDIQNIITTFRADPGKSVSFYDVFGMLLPPRRVDDVTKLISRESFDAVRDADVNVFDRETNTLIFSNYKTKKNYGMQQFKLSIIPSDDNVLARIVGVDIIRRAIHLLRCVPVNRHMFIAANRLPFGEKHFSTAYKRHYANKFCTNDVRHFWSSEARKLPLDQQRVIADMMAHSVGLAINYAVQEPQQQLLPETQ